MKPDLTDPDPTTRGSKRSRITKEITAEKAKRRHLDIELEKLAAALQANDNTNTIKRSRLDFVAAVERLDPVTREMLIQTVVELMPAGIEKTRVQTWFTDGSTR